MDIENIIAIAGKEKSSAALAEFLKSYLNPAFASLPKSETELLVLRLLTNLGAVHKNPGVYELVSKLKITRSKARKLIYDQELRSRTAQDLDEEIRNLLRHPVVQKSGDVFVLEVENPLLSDHLRAKVQAQGFITDGSFSPSIVKLSLDAMTSLVESYLAESDKQAIQDALIAAGAPDKSLNGVLKAVLRKLGEKLADKAGEAIADEASQYMSPILDGAVDIIQSSFRALFSRAA